MDDFDRLTAETSAAIDAAADLAALEAVRVAALGRKGAVADLMKNLAALDAEARRDYGAKVNVLKDALTQRIEARRAVLADLALAERLRAETVALTLPAPPATARRIHPIRP